MNIPEFTAIKKTGRKISMLTAYDFPTAKLVDAAGIDGILVGDSLAMVVQGRENTLPVTLEQMAYHTEMVVRAAKNAVVIADLPFPGGHQHWTRTLEDCAKILKDTGCHGVKIESSAAQAPVIERLTNAGIPVLAHLGLLPQRIQQLGKYTLQRQKETLLNDAHAVENAGAFAVLLECVQHDLAGEISESLAVPTIGIGSGPRCDGQILVLHDILGMSGYVPKHARQYAQLAEQISQAVNDYKADVESGGFPTKNR
ncbi:MAG: 3-methyl-2-oxobutanoate hydroxymethyltransferase [Planctomycetia bacterium]|nr:3-methyl-2-oxobutanoate hydroxymethyltransferase [Planctomycetia bacterium]